VRCGADLQSVHEFRCYDNIHLCKLVALYTANAYSAEREMSASVCTRFVAGISLVLWFTGNVAACGHRHRDASALCRLTEFGTVLTDAWSVVRDRALMKPVTVDHLTSAAAEPALMPPSSSSSSAGSISSGDNGVTTVSGMVY